MFIYDFLEQPPKEQTESMSSPRGALLNLASGFLEEDEDDDG